MAISGVRLRPEKLRPALQGVDTQFKLGWQVLAGVETLSQITLPQGQPDEVMFRRFSLPSDSLYRT